MKNSLELQNFPAQTKRPILKSIELPLMKLSMFAGLQIESTMYILMYNYNICIF